MVMQNMFLQYYYSRPMDFYDPCTTRTDRNTGYLTITALPTTKDTIIYLVVVLARVTDHVAGSCWQTRSATFG